MYGDGSVIIGVKRPDGSRTSVSFPQWEFFGHLRARSLTAAELRKLVRAVALSTEPGVGVDYSAAVRERVAERIQAGQAGLEAAEAEAFERDVRVRSILIAAKGDVEALREAVRRLSA